MAGQRLAKAPPEDTAMPLVTLTVVRPKSVEFKDSVLKAVHEG